MKAATDNWRVWRCRGHNEGGCAVLAWKEWPWRNPKEGMDRDWCPSCGTFTAWTMTKPEPGQHIQEPLVKPAALRKRINAVNPKAAPGLTGSPRFDL